MPLLFLLTVTLPVPLPVPVTLPVTFSVPVTLPVPLPLLLPWHLCSGGHIIPNVFKDAMSGKEPAVTGGAREEATTISL